MTIKIKIFILLMISGSLWSQQYSIKQLNNLLLSSDTLSIASPEKAILLSKKIYTYSQKANYPLGKMRSLENIAYLYYTLGETEKAIEYAVKEEKTAIEAKDYMFVCAALRLKAVCYSKLGFFEEADKALAKSLTMANLIPDIDKLHAVKGAIYQAKSLVSFDKNKELKDSLLVNNKKALNEFLLVKNKAIRDPNLGSAYLNVADSYTDFEKLDQAKYYLDKALALAIRDKDGYNEYHIMYNLGRIFYKKKDVKKAIFYYNETIKKARVYKDPYMIKQAYDVLSYCYGDLKDKEKQQEYQLKFYKLKDSLAANEKAAAKTPLHEVVKENEAKFSETKNNLYLIITISTILFIIALFIAFRFLKNYKKEKTAKLEKEVTIIERNKKVAELETKVNSGFEAVIELAKKDDPCFLTRFKEVYPEFYNKLAANESLTPGDLKFCALLKLNFSSKEIAYYTHASIRTIESRKHRIRKKLDIPSTEDLNLWMMAY